MTETAARWEGYEELGAPAGRKKADPLERWADDVMGAARLVADERGEVYRYDGARWCQITSKQLGKLIYLTCGGGTVRSSMRAEVAALVTIRSMIEDIPWRRLGDTEVPFLDGVVDAVTQTTREHRADDYLEWVAPHHLDRDAACPLWLQVMERWFGSADDDRAAALQEFAGYCILPHARYKKALLAYGKGDTGKSLVLWMLGQLVGPPPGSCTLAIEHMHDLRHRVVLRGAQLNVAGELSGRELTRTSGFKSLVSTGEPVMIDPKYEPPYQYIPAAKHAFATNVLPRIGGRQEEVLNRLLIVRFDRVLGDAEIDEGMQARLSAEMPGIFAWAVRGAAALVAQRGRFTEPVGRAEVLDEWAREEDPVVDWLSDSLVERPGWRMPFREIAQKATESVRRSITTKQVGRAVRHLGIANDVVKISSTRSPLACVIGFDVVPATAVTQETADSYAAAERLSRGEV